MSEYIPAPSETVWLMFDKSNGHKESRRYVWWFSTKKQAQEFAEDHMKIYNHSDLSEPIPYIRRSK